MKMIMILVDNEPPYLVPATALSDIPDGDGMIKLASPYDSASGSKDEAHESRCFEFDENLMKRVNDLVFDASTNMKIAMQTIFSHAKNAFTQDDVERVLSTVLGEDCPKH